MEKFCQHIEILLAQHDYVVVPNLGGFVVQTMTSEILSDRITPPLTTIGFNPLMLHSDGLLAFEIARSETITYRMAMELIESEVGKIKRHLSETGIVQLSNLGVFSLNSSGNIIFSPGSKADYLPVNFGLNDVYVTERNIQPKVERKKITLTLPSSRTYKYAAACILILSLLFVAPKLNDTRLANKADLLSTISFKTLENNYKNQPTAVIGTLLSDSLTEISDTIAMKNYHVIVASLPTQKSADAYCKVLTNDNFGEAHVLSPIKTYRVAIKSFSELDAAVHYMENLRKSDKRFETAWVLCN